jgi:hypothetical protein
MKNKTAIIISLCVFIGMSVWGQWLHAAAVTVVRKPGSVTTLDAGWDWAVRSAQQKNNKDFYIGYSIMREMHEHSYTGRVVHGNNEKTLSELIYNKKLPGPGDYGHGKTIGEIARKALKHSKKLKHDHGKKVWKELAFIFRFQGNVSGCKDLHLSTMELTVDFDAPGPLYWLGKVKDGESISFLENYYRRLGKSIGRKLPESDLIDMKERLVTAVAMHQDKQRPFNFLKGILTGGEPGDVREKAAFWIGESQMPGAAKLLLNTASNDRSEDVREKAVFGLYLHHSKEADNGLIQLAKRGKDIAVRKKAIFWLGQKAVKRSAEILNDVVNEAKESKIQKAAIFALSQLNDGQGVPSLIKIAKTHQSLSVRKKAIFWLSQSEDPRALDTIIELIEK